MRKGTNTFNKTKENILKSTSLINIIWGLSILVISFFIVGGEIDAGNVLTFILICFGLGIFFTLLFNYIFYVFYYPNIIIKNPIIDDDLNYVIEKYIKQSDKSTKNLKILPLRGVSQPFNFLIGPQLCELFLMLTDNDLIVYRHVQAGINREKCEIHSYNEIINTNLTNATVNAYSANFKFFILTLRNGESIQMLACDYDGKLQEKYDNIKVINERKGD